MKAEFSRDTAATALVLGVFASSWYGWAQAEPPASWRRALAAAAVLSVLVALAGGVLTARRWSDGTVFDGGTSRTFGVIVGIEIAAAGVGAFVLAFLHRSDLTPAWVALVVGVHLFPVARLLHIPMLYITAGLVTLSALIAVPLARAQSLAISSVAGTLTGTVLLVTAIVALLGVIA